MMYETGCNCTRDLPRNSGASSKTLLGRWPEHLPRELSGKLAMAAERLLAGGRVYILLLDTIEVL